MNINFCNLFICTTDTHAHAGGQKELLVCTAAVRVTSQLASRMCQHILTSSEIHRSIRGVRRRSITLSGGLPRSPARSERAVQVKRFLGKNRHFQGSTEGSAEAFASTACSFFFPPFCGQHGGIVQGSVHNSFPSTHRDSESNWRNISAPVFFFFFHSFAAAAAAAAKAPAHFLPARGKRPLGDPELSCNAQ